MGTDSKAPMGKPSGTGREGSGLQEVNDAKREGQLADNYLNEAEKPDENVNIRHENRNTDKGRDDQGEDSTSV